MELENTVHNSDSADNYIRLQVLMVYRHLRSEWPQPLTVPTACSSLVGRKPDPTNGDIGTKKRATCPARMTKEVFTFRKTFPSLTRHWHSNCYCRRAFFNKNCFSSFEHMQILQVNTRRTYPPCLAFQIGIRLSGWTIERVKSSSILLWQTIQNALTPMCCELQYFKV